MVEKRSGARVGLASIHIRRCARIFLNDALGQIAALAADRSNTKAIAQISHRTYAVTAHVFDLVVSDLAANAYVHGYSSVDWA